MLQEINCRIVNSILDYFETSNIDAEPLLEGISFNKEYLKNPLNWIPADTCNLIFERAAHILNDPNAMYSIGFSTPFLNYFMDIKRLLMLLEEPQKVLEFLPLYADQTTRVHKFEVFLIKPNTAIIRSHNLIKMTPSKGMCKYFQGILASVPTLWQMPPATVIEHKCSCLPFINDPDNPIEFNPDYCEYEATWQEPQNRKENIQGILSQSNFDFSDRTKEIEDLFFKLDEKNNQLIRRNFDLNIVRQLGVNIGSVKTERNLYKLISETGRDIPGIRFVLVEKLHASGNFFQTHYYSKFRSKTIALGMKALGFEIDNMALTQQSMDKLLRFPVSKIPMGTEYINNPQIVTIEYLSQILDNVWGKKLCDALQTLLKIKKFIIVPINPDNKLQGVLIFFLDSEAPMDIIEMIGSHCSIGLKNILNTAALEQRNSELETLTSIASKITDSLDIDTIIEHTVSELRKIYVCESIAIGLVNKDGKKLDIIGEYGMPLERKSYINIREGTNLERFIRSDEPLGTDFQQNKPPLFKKQMHVDLAPMIYLYAPLVIDGKRSGIISIKRNRLQPQFQEAEKSLLISISNQISIALENAQLHGNLLVRIHDLEKTKTKLAEAEEKMRLTLESMAEGIMVTDKNGKIIRANESAANLYGYTEHCEFLRKSGLRYVDSKDRRRFLENLKNAYEGSPSRNVEYTFIKKDNTRFPAETTISAFINAAGIADGYVICIRDISERRNAEKALRDSEKKYRLITDNSSDLISIIDLNGKFKFLSPSYQLLGRDPCQYIGKSCLESVHPDDITRLVNHLNNYNLLGEVEICKLARNNFSEELEYRCIDAWGNCHVLETKASIIESLEGNDMNILLMSRDITSRKEAQEELRKLYSQEQNLRNSLEQEIAKRAEFFRALVHELKTPLTPIIASTEAIKDMASNDIVERLAENAFSGALRLDSRVNELLDISRGEMGMLKANRAPFNVSQLLKELFEYNKPQADNNQQEFITEFGDELPTIIGDEIKIRQVITNLLNNAMKFTQKGGRIILKAWTTDKDLVIEVQDNGKGISEEEQKRIFEPYNRIEADRQNYSGLGLGLALCKQFVELHHGEIWIKSSLGNGSTFTFSLPLVKNNFEYIEE